jgi:hypothetical protein
MDALQRRDRLRQHALTLREDEEGGRESTLFFIARRAALGGLVRSYRA